MASLLLGLAPSGTASAGTREDAGLWFMFAGQGPLGSGADSESRWRWWFDAQPRYLEDTSGLHQGLLRPGVGYTLGARTSAWLGYAYVTTDRGSRTDSEENRIWQQFLWLPRYGDVRFQSRTRLEQRFLDTGSDTGWRFRQFVKAGWPVPVADRLSVVGYEELFLDLNDTSWGQRGGFAQNRLFVGLAWALDAGRRTSLEIGYLNQFINSRATDRMNHILAINLLLTL